LYAAAQFGNLAVLQCCDANESVFVPELTVTDNEHAALEQNLCKIAAENGHLEVLKWVHWCYIAANIDRIDHWTLSRKYGRSWEDAKTCSGAARNGHLEVLQWVHQEWMPMECKNLFRGCF
jgi:hypothetical protein